MIPRLPSFREKSLVSIRTKYFRKFYYNQTLDHFNYLPESFKTFNQRYFINFKYWGGANSSTPIFVTFGGEATLEEDSQEYVGFIEENAASFKALLVYIEVRFCRTIIFLLIFNYLIQIFFFTFKVLLIVLSKHFFYHCQYLRQDKNMRIKDELV
jgi:hypothetical protein